MGDGLLTVEFLKCELLGFTDEAKDHAPRDQVESCVKSDCGLLADEHVGALR